MNEPQLGLDLYPTDYELIKELSSIYDQQFLADYLNKQPNSNWTRETINRWLKGKAAPKLSKLEYDYLEELLPKPKVSLEDCDFTFIDLFAGIGGIRKGFEEQNGYCVFSSEWDKFARRTYKANFACDHAFHTFNEDIRDITLSMDSSISEEEAYKHIDINVPNHDILLAGFPCQPFSLAGVSKKNSLGAKHGFECSTQGTLFFDVARIINEKRPAAFLLENVRNLVSHDKGRTFSVIMRTLEEELGYTVSFKIMDASKWVPQKRMRIAIVGFRDGHSFDFDTVGYPETSPLMESVLHREGELHEDPIYAPGGIPDAKYTLTDSLWSYLQRHAAKHASKGNGFGYGLVKPTDVARTLSARYGKDGSEILVAQKDRNPRRLTPRECSRIMGFDGFGGRPIIIPVSDTQAYKQFGNSVVVPCFEAIAKAMLPHIASSTSRSTIRHKSA